MGTVAVTGIGDLGAGVLRILAQMPGVSRLYALDVDETRLMGEVADAAAVASYGEGGTRIDPIVVDMRNEDRLADALARVQPDVVVNTATLQSWWVITQLPQAVWRRLEEQARFGPWLPMHLTLALKLMLSERRRWARPSSTWRFPTRSMPCWRGWDWPRRVGRATPTCSGRGFARRPHGA